MHRSYDACKLALTKYGKVKPLIKAEQQYASVFPYCASIMLLPGSYASNYASTCTAGLGLSYRPLTLYHICTLL